jgi:hypothetical protein
MMKTYFEKWNHQKVQLSNLKSYLQQILVSIRLNIPSQNIRYQLREQIDFANYSI